MIKSLDILVFNEILEDMKGMATKIYDTLGSGHSEAVYHSAFEVELRNKNISYEKERVYPIMYYGQFIGFNRADLVIDKKIAIELKAIQSIGNPERIQTKLYLNDEPELAILINFTQPNKNGESKSMIEFEVFGNLDKYFKYQ